ncbi:MAG: hypothetical protein LBK63_07240 [Treponema sp.]|nr:hypothetical protein [Treponema sp.]
MDANELLKERTELYANVLQFKKNKRVPIHANFWTWKTLDAGYKLSEALYDVKILAKINEEFNERYQFDSYSDLGTRNPLATQDALGGGYHKIDQSDEALLVDDHHLLERDEYKDLAKNPMGVYWTKAFKRYCRPGITVGEIKNALKVNDEFSKFGASTTDICLNKWGAMKASKYFFSVPFETLFNALRGMKEVSLDIRKCKQEMKEAMDVLFAMSTKPFLEQAAKDDDLKGCACSVNIGFLAQSVLSVDQFAELYWPYVKQILDVLIAHNRALYIFGESHMLRFAEFFQDIPKGHILYHLEQDDIFEVRKRLPNMALAGGMPTELLGRGTKQECVDYAKKLIDTLGDGFVFSQNKMISFRKDATRENVLAVNEFVRNYQY